VWPPRKDRSRTPDDRINQVLAEARKIARFKDKSIASIYSTDRLSNSGWIYAVMEYIEGEPLKNIWASLNWASLNDPSNVPWRPWIWRHVFNALDVAERAGVYHGDLHEGNVIVTSFMGDVTLIDFGTSVLAYQGHSMRRHAKMVNRFAQRLLPELKQYIEPFDIPNLVTPEYATIAVNQWVEASTALQELDKSLAENPEQDLSRQMHSLAANTSSTHIDINEPVVRWLRNKGIPRDYVDVYILAAKNQLARHWRWRQSTSFVARPVPATKSWINPEWFSTRTTNT
jgi:serine/threonine protein kinase